MNVEQALTLFEIAHFHQLPKLMSHLLPIISKTLDFSCAISAFQRIQLLVDSAPSDSLSITPPKDEAANVDNKLDPKVGSKRKSTDEAMEEPLLEGSLASKNVKTPNKAKEWTDVKEARTLKDSAANDGTMMTLRVAQTGNVARGALSIVTDYIAQNARANLAAMLVQHPGVSKVTYFGTVPLPTKPIIASNPVPADVTVKPTASASQNTPVLPHK
jgi:hypothetical protein